MMVAGLPLPIRIMRSLQNSSDETTVCFLNCQEAHYFLKKSVFYTAYSCEKKGAMVI